MESVVRALVIYLILLVLLRLAGKRTLGQITTFDLILILIISETVQQALVQDDRSLTHAVLLVVTLIAIDAGLAALKQRFPRIDRWIEGVPAVLVEDGVFHRERMNRERVDEAEILAAARDKQGLASLDEIRHAVLERSGDISIVPRRSAK